MNMLKRDFYYPSSDGKTTIHGIEWTPENVKHYKGIIQVAHGLNEQMSLYEPFAKYFTDRGFIVRGNDHLGHGESVYKNEPRIYLGPKGSWHFASDDIYTCRILAEKEYGKLPYIMFGFSLGSYLMRDYLIRYGGTVDAGVLVGCLSFPDIATFWGNIIVKVLEFFLGEKSKPAIVDFLMNQTNNLKFKPNKTPIDWINEDEDEVKRLLADPYASEKPTVGMFRELLYAIRFTKDYENVVKMNKDNPIFFISGKDDPVARGGKTIIDLVKLFEKAGIKDVHYKLYEGRHRIIFEKTGRLALDYIYDWACSKLKTEDTDTMEKTNPMLNNALKSLLKLAKAGVKEANELIGNLFEEKELEVCDDELADRYNKVTSKIVDLISNKNVKQIIDIGCGYSPRYIYLKRSTLLDKYNVKYVFCDLPAVISETKSMYNEMKIDTNNADFKMVDITNYTSIKNAIANQNEKVAIIVENIEDCLFDFEIKLANKNITKLFNEYKGYYISSEEENIEFKSGNELKNETEMQKEHRFRMRHETEGNCVKVRVEGALDSINAPKLLDYINSLDVELKNKKLRLDLSKIDYILSAGLMVLEDIENKYIDADIIYSKNNR